MFDILFMFFITNLFIISYYFLITIFSTGYTLIIVTFSTDIFTHYNIERSWLISCDKTASVFISSFILLYE